MYLGDHSLEELVAEYQRRLKRNEFLTLFNDPLRYPKHNYFFEMGASFRQRLFMAGNRVGKTSAALCEIVMHLTGEYPPEWKGHRFTKENNWWLVGRDGKTLLDTLQPMLLGKVGNFGTGLIPKDKLDFFSLSEATKTSSRVNSFRVRHINNEWSEVQFRTSESGRAAFQGTERSIYIDEECSQAVYEECLLRTLTGNNILIMTFTPLFGSTPLIRAFYGGQFRPGDMQLGLGKYVVQTSMDDCPHLSKNDIEELLASCHPSQRDARRKGWPELSAGHIFPVDEKEIKVPRFEIPAHFKRIYGLDVGWNNTAACWIAVDPDTNIKYVYSIYKQGQKEASIHASQIKTRGTWIPGIIDSAAGGSSQVDGRNLKDLYAKEGLLLENANKSVHAGLFLCYDELAKGQIKIFEDCVQFFEEYREYKYGPDGKPIKENDHIMDAFRYAMMKIASAIAKPIKKDYVYDTAVSATSRTGW